MVPGFKQITISFITSACQIVYIRCLNNSRLEFSINGYVMLHTRTDV